ncbi:uncharacterized protein SPAPADRAFT_65359 [Spathaspora passalidarum NRRL Y-27907]|uniref:BIR-domain-containing protein n=1 Tax=Spathaspora passalidarum (strain NRRL Y-27907 / 11-Y1) TaxID=619300 RepID=G3AHN3_SPAPN|nr:uncharacterized protein SPAPADRAFT_65359 [Spathaspora passalidarum NRRL Y-27907]EGW34197.1 hypothetical protein SPAPADRAFT_65359 [Spathaspora passalidarum NRRL Y-27907]
MAQDDNMIYRENRQQTFEEPIEQSWGAVDWKQEQNEAWTDELVNSGFYYAPTLMDKSRVVCAYCNGEEILDEIADPLDVCQVHASKGGCLWSLARVAMVDSLRYKTKRSNKSYWKRQKHTILNDPLSEEAIDFRKGFFTQTYPLDIGDQRPNSRSLSEAGFIYSPNHVGDDRVVCIYCGCALDYWESGDDPVEEHKKNETSYCYFLDTHTEQNKKRRRRKKAPVVEDNSQIESKEESVEPSIKQISPGYIEKEELVESIKQSSPIVIEDEEEPQKTPPIEVDNYTFGKETKSPYTDLNNSSTILQSQATYKSKAVKRRFKERDLNVDDLSSDDIANDFIMAAILSQDKELTPKKKKAREVTPQSIEDISEEDPISSYNTNKDFQEDPTSTLNTDNDSQEEVPISTNITKKESQENGSVSIKSTQESGISVDSENSVNYSPVELEFDSEESQEAQPVDSASEEEEESQSEESQDESSQSASEDEDESVESSIIETQSDDDYVESDDSEVIEIEESTPEKKLHKKKIMGISPRKEDDLSGSRTRRKRLPEPVEPEPKIPKKQQKLNLKKLQSVTRNDIDTSFDNIDYGEGNVEQLEKIIITSQIEPERSPSDKVPREKDIPIPKISPIKFAGQKRTTKRTSIVKSQPSIFDVSFEAPPKRLTLGRIETPEEKDEMILDNLEDKDQKALQETIEHKPEPVIEKRRTRQQSKAQKIVNDDMSAGKSKSNEKEKPKRSQRNNKKKEEPRNESAEIVDEKISNSGKSILNGNEGGKKSRQNKKQEEASNHSVILMEGKDENSYDNTQQVKKKVRQSKVEKDIESEVEEEQEPDEQPEEEHPKEEEIENNSKDKEIESEQLVQVRNSLPSPKKEVLELHKPSNGKLDHSINLQSPKSSDHVSDSEQLDEVSIKEKYIDAFEPDLDDSESDNEQDYANYLRDIQEISEDIDKLYDADGKTINSISFVQREENDKMDKDLSSDESEKSEEPEQENTSPSSPKPSNAFGNRKSSSIIPVDKEMQVSRETSIVVKEMSSPQAHSTLAKIEPNKETIADKEDIPEVDHEKNSELEDSKPEVDQPTIEIDRPNNSVSQDPKSEEDIQERQSNVEVDDNENSVLENPKELHTQERQPNEGKTSRKELILPKLPGSNEPITSPLAMCSSPMLGSISATKDNDPLSEASETQVQKPLNDGNALNLQANGHKMKWEAKPITEMLAKMSYLQSSAEEVKKLANSNYGLHDDVNGDLTRFISEMPEEEEGMTIKEWIEHCAKNCYDIVVQNGDETREFLKEEYLRAIATIEELPTDD